MTFKRRSYHMQKVCEAIYAPHTPNREFIAFDTETTGLDDDARILELAALKMRVVDSHLEEIDRLHIYMIPDFGIPEHATDISGMSKAEKSKLSSVEIAIGVNGLDGETLRKLNAITENEAFPIIRDFFQPPKNGSVLYTCGYNVGFDNRMMQALYRRQNARAFNAVGIDVMPMARDLVSPDEVDNYKLGTIVNLYGLDKDISFHSAIDDIIATMRLMEALHKEYAERKMPECVTHLDYKYAYWWDGFNVKQRGIYVCTTDDRKLFFNTYTKTWKSTEINLEEIDLDYLERELCRRLNVTYSDMERMTKKKFEYQKQMQKQKGIYL